MLDRNPPRERRGRAVLVGLQAPPVLRDLSRADQLQPRRPGRAPLPQGVPRADLVGEVLELGIFEADEGRTLRILDIVVNAPYDRIDGSFVALVGPVGLDAISISILVRAEVEARRPRQLLRRVVVGAVVIITEPVVPPAQLMSSKCEGEQTRSAHS